MFEENDDLNLFRESIAKFLDKECPVENIARWEAEDAIPRSVLAGMAELGILGLTVPEEYGGLGTNVMMMCVVMEDLAARWSGLASLYI